MASDFKGRKSNLKKLDEIGDDMLAGSIFDLVRWSDSRSEHTGSHALTPTNQSCPPAF